MKNQALPVGRAVEVTKILKFAQLIVITWLITNLANHYYKHLYTLNEPVYRSTISYQFLKSIVIISVLYFGGFWNTLGDLAKMIIVSWIISRLTVFSFIQKEKVNKYDFINEVLATSFIIFVLWLGKFWNSL